MFVILRFPVILAAAAVLALAVPAASAGLLRPSAAPPAGPAFEIGHIPECLQAVPGALALGGDDIRLDALVLTDGVALHEAASVMGTAARAYAPLGITLVTTFREVSFTGRSAFGLIEQSTAAVGGRRPPGVDVVHVVTGKDIEALGTDAVGGAAACIGGVAFADQAFSVSEAPAASPAITPLLAAKIAAHEIGHLLGAHHHYANCVEGLLALSSGDPTPCTLMFNDAGLAALRFSTLNGVVVRGHAEAYAAG